MDASERALLEQTVRDAISSTSGGFDKVDEVLADLGWLEMLRDEPHDAVAIVFGALGSTNGAGSMLDDVLLAALGMTPEPGCAVLLPPFGSSAPPASVDGDRVFGTGLATARATTASEMVAVAVTGDAVTIARVPMSAVNTEPARGVDPRLGLHVAHVDVQDADATGDTRSWEPALAAGRIALAHELAAASRAMLELARTHALERVQFDRPIAHFQAVRHRLAETLVAIEACDASLVAAADEPGPMTAALAKALAGRAARTAATHCQQVLAGIGFTTDHPFHRFLKRTMALDGLLGSTDALTFDLGRELLATRRVPTLIEL